MTWWLWLVVVLVALAVFVLLGLGLWRKVRVLLAELRTLTELTAPLAEAGGVTAAVPPVRPGFLTTAGERTAVRERRRKNIHRRRERRELRAGDALARWRRLGVR